jgi:hypothetical protein
MMVMQTRQPGATRNVHVVGDSRLPDASVIPARIETRYCVLGYMFNAGSSVAVRVLAL